MRSLTVSAILSSFLFGCAARSPTRVIEPIEPGSNAVADSTSSAEDGFVLSREAVETPERLDFPIHLEDKWYPFRAEYLGLSVQQAKLRDLKIGNGKPPVEFWDQQTAIEAVSIWSGLCNECHGGRRQLKDALDMASPASAWGKGDGLFFGKKKPYAKVFKTIFEGGPPVDGEESEMPEWGKRLSREQIWSLIYFLEYQSGGIEGRFPPSLYPRRSTPK